jgi:sterol desaturase/sphingolipid hydroxylase (fatty acid hydroxylase superfamily)
LLKSILAATLFPITLVGAAVGAYWLNQSHGYSSEAAAAATTIAAGLWIWVWEFILPYRKEWNKADSDLATDAIHLSITAIMTKFIKPLYVFLLIPAVGYLGARYGSDELWPHHWNLVGQLALMLVLCEFGRYWFHRLSHSVQWLWRFHAVHHSPNRLYWLNAGRFHPVERMYLQIPELLPFILLNPSETVLMMYLVTNSVHGFFQHANVRTQIGLLNYVFSMTELHRWHHSKAVDQSHKNFGNILIIWDLVFGSFFLPQDKEVGVIGVLNPDYPKDYIGQIVAPFQYRKDKPFDYEQRKDFYLQQAAGFKDNATL